MKLKAVKAEQSLGKPIAGSKIVRDARSSAIHFSLANSKRANQSNRNLQLHLINMTPRKGERNKKADKNSDSESEMQSPTETERENTKEISHTEKANDLAKVHTKLLARLLAFGGILFITFATRFYALEDPSHIW